ncbi:hypothetical protein [Duganella vulcania]|uniref:Uncharacterized protein n=1 Tax=Duganella vulcania TaxID=2692166 RepID=A0A845GFJ0_9BURK|nr:hypothetical protein [Duganella vulcania]MYM92711.1 hypothetical protein [Duganella vulcania]
MNRAVRYGLLIAVNGVISAGGAYYAYSKAIAMPVAPQVALIDVEAVVNSVRPEEAGSKERARERINELKALAKKIAGEGVIVLDSRYVIDAPDDAYIGSSVQNLKKEK